MNPTNLLCKLALALVLLGGAATQAVSAAQIEFDVWLNRYGYVEVRPGSATGGAIRHDSRGYYTDRVNRGEHLFVFATPSPGEQTSARYGVWCDALGRYLVGPVAAPWYDWCWYEDYIVPTNPSADNLYVRFWTSASRLPFQKRIPIGYRNP